jgi:hypothetical protein
MLARDRVFERRDDRMAATVEFARASIIPSGLQAAG